MFVADRALITKNIFVLTIGALCVCVQKFNRPVILSHSSTGMTFDTVTLAMEVQSSVFVRVEVAHYDGVTVEQNDKLWLHVARRKKESADMQ